MRNTWTFQLALCTCCTTTPERKGQTRGQWVGEMEVWALKGFGVSHILQEMLTYKSGRTIPKPENAPKSFRLLIQELRSLALELKHFLISEKNFQINRKEVQSE
ncbi:hypothetical protein NC653_008112 [Populus alba x Populus x berolinensis]|uniref:DNA-directed RNA polymerase n=1 Tax=Populus alba x Populus x berolinensis TaxID=444605 RepID=A0AAD6W8N2_9ROSI|nr:hypothetical protein NC653_008112 [Populus alba x Populus x berolinensis]